MHRLLLVYVIIFFIAGFVNTQAKVYNYKDAQGNNIFTDDLSQVPEDQRTGVKTYESIKSKPIQPKPIAPKPPKTAPKLISKDLEELKKWLSSENEALNREKEALEAMKPEINLPKDQQVYNAKVRSINERINIYKKKLADYQEMLKQEEK